MPLPFDGDGLLESSYSSLGGLQFPTLSNAASSFPMSNVASPSLITIDPTSHLPSPIYIGTWWAFLCFYFSNSKCTLDAIILLFPSFVQPRSNGSIHVDYLATSFENVIILND
jgi:hypothetical protein